MGKKIPVGTKKATDKKTATKKGTQKMPMPVKC